MYGHGESKCRTLHLELKKSVLEEKNAEEKNAKGKVILQRIYINGKVVMARWNSTRRRFRIERGLEGLMSASSKDASSPSKKITTINLFDALRDDGDDNNDKKAQNTNTQENVIQTSQEYHSKKITFIVHQY